MSSRLSGNWSYPTAIRVEAGAVGGIAEACTDSGIERPLVVTDSGMVGLEPLDAVVRGLESAGMPVSIFSGATPNPTGVNVADGIAEFRAGDHDGVVAVGGGSAIDVGKLVAFAAEQRRPLWDFEDVGDNWTRADVDSIAPVVAVPTTAGTGSEVGRAAVVINADEQRKVIIFHPKMLPARVIADPELTVGLPRLLTVGTGMDALSHSLEALCSPRYHPMSRGIAMEGCRLVFEHLPRVVADPADLESRTHMMTAAAMGAVAFQRGLGAMHALSHPIGALFGTHHGMTNATVMPYVLEANLVAADSELEALARYVQIAGGSLGLVQRVLSMRVELGVPHTLAELGVDLSRREEVVAGAVRDPSATTNPLAVTPAFADQLFEAAYHGELRAR